jgi:cytochrome c oxidase subunit 4
MTQAEAMEATEAREHGEGLGHVTPIRVLLAVWLALVVLTVITVSASWVDLGRLNLVIALGIAVTKASFVALYFMHLRYDRPFHGIVFICSVLFVMLFIGLALMDTKEYQPEMIPGHQPAMTQQEEAG